MTKQSTTSRNSFSLADLDGLVGQELGQSEWHRITQKQIDLFAEATGDYAAIHVDPEAAANSPFGSTIAHGFLTLSLVAALTQEAFNISDARNLINYGVNRVRFPTPVPVGGRVMLKTSLVSVEDRPMGRLLTLSFEIHMEGSTRQAAVGETLLLVVEGDG